MTSGSGNGWPDVTKVTAQKIGHDPLCPVDPPRMNDGFCIWCDVIRKARAEERRAMSALVDRYSDRLDAANQTLTDLRAAVEALRVEAGQNEHASLVANYEGAAYEYRAQREVLDKVLSLIDGSK